MTNLTTDKEFNLRVQEWMDEVRMQAYYNILNGKETDGVIREETINEERIHTEQMKWLLFIPYYVLYLVFFLVYLLCTLNFKRAYELNPFEREAKMNKGNLDYKTKYGWIKYL